MFFLQYLFFLFHGCFLKTLEDPMECPQSNTTIKFVNSCPLSTTEWTIAAEKMNCHHKENTCSSFVYHCVMNFDVTKMIEVCAPVTNILGECLV